jgi:hypothetical protein
VEGATATKGFGSGALKVKGRIYASLTRGRLLVKLPAHRVDDIVKRDRAAGLVAIFLSARESQGYE